jgi:hypothetical protein
MQPSRFSLLALSGACLAAATAAAQTPPPPAAAAQPFEAGKPLGVVNDGQYAPMSANVKVYGGIVSAESCSYDRTRKLIMVVNRGAAQNEAPNDGFVSLLNSDGSVHTARWIGVNRNGLMLNQPFGSDVHAGKLYLADSDGGTADGAPRTAVVRLFDIASGAPAGEIKFPDRPGSTTSPWRATAPSTLPRPALPTGRRRCASTGSRLRVPFRSSSKARRWRFPMASPSTKAGTSSWSTSAATTS